MEKGIANILDFTMPTGAKGNMLSVKSWLSLILGSFMLLITFALGQSLKNMFAKKFTGIDTNIESIIKDPVTAQVDEIIL